MAGGICHHFRIFCSHISVGIAEAVKSAIGAAEYNQRRANLIAKLRRTALNSIKRRPVVVVMRSAIRQFYAPDVPYPFRQCSYFRYLGGLVEPNSVLVIFAEPNREPKSILYVEERTEHQELWEGPMLSVNEIANMYGLEEIKERKQLMFDLQMLTNDATVSYDITTMNIIRDDISQVLSGSNVFIPLREHIDSLRWIKSRTEQYLMRESCCIGAQAMNAVISKSRDVSSENEIVGRLELEVRRRGASCLAYPPVVAGANRANIIHYLDANKAVNNGDTVLVDAGCDYQGYSSDITRVFPVSGCFSAIQRTLYDALNDVQSRLLQYVKETEPLKLSELYLAMIGYLAHNLSEIGIFPSDIGKQELLHETGRLCPHHVSHYLGLDVHDTASVARNIPLQPGVTFTVEPGIYVRHENEKVRKEFRGIGMRIEDDILIRDDGAVEILTKDAIRDSQNIELLMRVGHVLQKNENC